MAQDGLARALSRSTPRSTATSCLPPRPARGRSRDPVFGLAELGALAADVVARAIAARVYEAQALPFAGALPVWRDKFGNRASASRKAAAAQRTAAAPDRRTASRRSSSRRSAGR